MKCNGFMDKGSERDAHGIGAKVRNEEKLRRKEKLIFVFRGGKNG